MADFWFWFSGSCGFFVKLFWNINKEKPRKKPGFNVDVREHGFFTCFYWLIFLFHTISTGTDFVLISIDGYVERWNLTINPNIKSTIQSFERFFLWVVAALLKIQLKIVSKNHHSKLRMIPFICFAKKSGGYAWKSNRDCVPEIFLLRRRSDFGSKS